MTGTGKETRYRFVMGKRIQTGKSDAEKDSDETFPVLAINTMSVERSLSTNRLLGKDDIAYFARREDGHYLCQLLFLPASF